SSDPSNPCHNDDSCLVNAGMDAQGGGIENSEGGPSYRYLEKQGKRSLAQSIVVSNAYLDKTGYRVEFEMPLAYSFLKSQTAQLFLVAKSPIEKAGLEDFYITSEWTYSDTSVHQIKFQGAKNCWIRNIESNKTPRAAHVWTYGS